jgi:hypothetical protein
LLVLIAAVATACGSAPTAPAETVSASLSVTSVENESVKEVWLDPVYPSACDGQSYLAVRAKVHHVTQTKTLSDGTKVTTQQFTYVGVKVTDPDGRTYTLARHSTFQQVANPDGTYTVVAVDTFRLRGYGANEDLTLTLRILWDGQNFVTEFTPILECR